MYENCVISKSDAIKACELLLECNKTRIPKESIKDLIVELTGKIVIC